MICARKSPIRSTVRILYGKKEWSNESSNDRTTAKSLHCEQDHQIYCSHIKLFKIVVVGIFLSLFNFHHIIEKMVECMWSSLLPLVHRRNEKKIGLCSFFVGTKQYERVEKLARNNIKLYYIKFFFFKCLASEWGENQIFCDKANPNKHTLHMQKAKQTK